jgi:hypothetical protein
MLEGLTDFLRDRKDMIVKKVRTNVVHKMTGYSEHTQWLTTVSYDEIETVDFEALLEQIDEFSKSFQK